MTFPESRIKTIRKKDVISHRLQLDVKTSFTDVFSLLMRSRGYALCCDFQTIHVFIAPLGAMLRSFLEQARVYVLII